MEPLITIQDLSYSYATKPALETVSFEIFQGEVCVILGPNGSGKSTLLHCMNGFLQPQNGTICIEKASIHELLPRQLARKISFVSQDQINTFPYAVIDMVVMGRTPHLNIFDKPSKKDYDIAWQIVEMIGIQELASRPYTQLSGGEKKIVRLAKAFAQDSDILLLDEPTAHLDLKNIHFILKTLIEYARNHGKTIIASMHDPNQVFRFAQNVIMISKGKILERGPLSTVMNSENLSRLYHIPLRTESVDDTTVVTYDYNLLQDHNTFEIME